MAVLLGAVACAGGQTGTEEWGKGVGGDDPCTAWSTPLAASAVSGLGFSLAELAANVSGPRSSSLTWRSLEPELSVGPEQGGSSLVLQLFPDLSKGRFVHYTPRTENGAGAAIGCPADELQLDAELSLESSGGALAERRRVVLHATSVSKASIRADLPLAEVLGSLSVVPASGYEVTSPVVVTEVDAATTHGALEGLLEQQSASSGVASARYITYACWPEGGSECQRP